VLERCGLRRRSWAVEWEASAIEFLLDSGFSPEMGARPLKRAIDQYLLAPLAATLVETARRKVNNFCSCAGNGRATEVEFVDPDADPPPAAVHPAPLSSLTLPIMILRPVGEPAECAALDASWAAVNAHLASPGGPSKRKNYKPNSPPPASGRAQTGTGCSPASPHRSYHRIRSNRRAPSRPPAFRRHENPARARYPPRTATPSRACWHRRRRQRRSSRRRLSGGPQPWTVRPTLRPCPGASRSRRCTASGPLAGTCRLPSILRAMVPPRSSKSAASAPGARCARKLVYISSNTPTRTIAAVPSPACTSQLARRKNLAPARRLPSAPAC
jgi:hypothetical protein